MPPKRRKRTSTREQLQPRGAKGQFYRAQEAAGVKEGTVWADRGSSSGPTRPALIDWAEQILRAITVTDICLAIFLVRAINTFFVGRFRILQLQEDLLQDLTREYDSSSSVINLLLTGLVRTLIVHYVFFSSLVVSLIWSSFSLTHRGIQSKWDKIKAWVFVIVCALQLCFPLLKLYIFLRTGQLADDHVTDVKNKSMVSVSRAVVVTCLRVVMGLLNRAAPMIGAAELIRVYWGLLGAASDKGVPQRLACLPCEAHRRLLQESRSVGILMWQFSMASSLCLFLCLGFLASLAVVGGYSDLYSSYTQLHQPSMAIVVILGLTVQFANGVTWLLVVRASYYDVSFSTTDTSCTVSMNVLGGAWGNGMSSLLLLIADEVGNRFMDSSSAQELARAGDEWAFLLKSIQYALYIFSMMASQKYGSMLLIAVANHQHLHSRCMKTSFVSKGLRSSAIRAIEKASCTWVKMTTAMFRMTRTHDHKEDKSASTSADDAVGVADDDKEEEALEDCKRGGPSPVASSLSSTSPSPSLASFDKHPSPDPLELSRWSISPSTSSAAPTRHVSYQAAVDGIDSEESLRLWRREDTLEPRTEIEKAAQLLSREIRDRIHMSESRISRTDAPGASEILLSQDMCIDQRMAPGNSSSEVVRKGESESVLPRDFGHVFPGAGHWGREHMLQHSAAIARQSRYWQPREEGQAEIHNGTGGGKEETLEALRQSSYSADEATQALIGYKSPSLGHRTEHALFLSEIPVPHNQFARAVQAVGSESELARTWDWAGSQPEIAPIEHFDPCTFAPRFYSGNHSHYHPGSGILGSNDLNSQRAEVEDELKIHEGRTGFGFDEGLKPFREAVSTHTSSFSLPTLLQDPRQLSHSPADWFCDSSTSSIPWPAGGLDFSQRIEVEGCRSREGQGQEADEHGGNGVEEEQLDMPASWDMPTSEGDVQELAHFSAATCKLGAVFRERGRGR